MPKWVRSISKKLPFADTLFVWQAKNGNRDAFGRLYLKYMDPIYRYIYFRIGQDPHLAEDLTSNVFSKAWEALPKYQNANFRAWLYQIARNTVTDYFREVKPHIDLTEDIADTTNIEADVDLILSQEALKKAFTKLTDYERQLITLKFIEELDTKEIAQILGKSPVAVRALQYRTLKKLKQILKNYV